MPAILAHRNTFWLLIGTPQSSPNFRPYFFLLKFVVLRFFGEEVEQHMLPCIADRKQICSRREGIPLLCDAEDNNWFSNDVEGKECNDDEDYPMGIGTVCVLFPI